MESNEEEVKKYGINIVNGPLCNRKEKSPKNNDSSSETTVNASFSDTESDED
jgi:hypothetical protein